MSETVLSRSVARAIETATGGRALVMRLNPGIVRVKGGVMHGPPKGTPDRLAVLPGGRVVWLEVKHPDAKPRKDQEHQLQMHERLRAMGHEVAVVRSMQEALSAIGARA